MRGLVEEDADLVVPGPAPVALHPAIVLTRALAADRTHSALVVFLEELARISSMQRLRPLALGRHRRLLDRRRSLRRLRQTHGLRVLVHVYSRQRRALGGPDRHLRSEGEQALDVELVHQRLHLLPEALGVLVCHVHPQERKQLHLALDRELVAQLLEQILHIRRLLHPLREVTVTACCLMLPALDLRHSLLAPPSHQLPLRVRRLHHLGLPNASSGRLGDTGIGEADGRNRSWSRRGDRLTGRRTLADVAVERSGRRDARERAELGHLVGRGEFAPGAIALLVEELLQCDRLRHHGAEKREDIAS
eukprot:767057-Hanusia_phi.AAC.5